MNRQPKRPWQEDADADKSLLGARPRIYSPVKRLILQQAASILQASNPFRDGEGDLKSRLGYFADTENSQHQESLSRSASIGVAPSAPRWATQTQGWDFEPLLTISTSVAEQEKPGILNGDNATSTGELQRSFRFRIPDAFIENLVGSSQPVPLNFPHMGLLPCATNELRYGQSPQGTPYSSDDAATPSSFTPMQSDNLTLDKEFGHTVLLNEILPVDDITPLIDPFSNGNTFETDQLLASDPVFQQFSNTLHFLNFEISGNSNLPGSAGDSADFNLFNTLKPWYQLSNQLGDFNSANTESQVDRNQFMGDIWPKAISAIPESLHPKELSIPTTKTQPAQPSSAGDIHQRRPSSKLLNKLSAETKYSPYSPLDISSSSPNTAVSHESFSQGIESDGSQTTKTSKKPCTPPEVEGENPFDESLTTSDGPNIVVFYTGKTENTKHIPKVRQPFKSMGKRKETAETRKTGACVRCRLQRVRIMFSGTRY